MILVERHGPMVWGVCRRLLSDRDTAADAFQATFLVLVRRARAVRVDDSLGPWLYGVSRRVAARARATSLRRRARETGGVEAVAGPAPDPGRAERLAILDEEIGRLPERQRAAIVLCDLEDLPHEEAAPPARLPGRDGREPPVPRAAAAARPPGAARARSGRRGALGRHGPRSFGRDARGAHQAYGPVRDEFSRGRRRAGGGRCSCRRSDPDDVACKAETAGRRRGGPDPRDRRGRRPGTPDSPRPREAREQAKTAPPSTAGAGAAAVPDMAANRALAREQLALIDEVLAIAASAGPRRQNQLADPSFSLWERRRLETLRKAGAGKAEIVAALEKYHQKPEGG